MKNILEGLAKTQQTLDIRPLMVLRLQTTAVDIGRSAVGMRRVATVERGEFEGMPDGLSGHVHAGGNDWITVETDGSTRLDAKVVLQTRAAEKILMSYHGIRHGPPGTLKNLALGLPVDPADYYFRIMPSFETSSKAFEWLNRIVAVGVGQRLPDGVVYSVFEVL